MKENNMKNKILLLLKSNKNYISGEELSRMLGITRSAIWKYIKSLRADGYVINSVTNRGYKLEDSSKVMNEIELSENLKTKWLGKKIIYLDNVDSTSSEIKRISVNNPPAGTTVVAEEQYGGKGRLGRLWTSPKGSGLWFSFILKPNIVPSQIAGITLVVGIGVCKAIRNYTGIDARIKWPNDVIIGNKKICGILTEMTAEADKIDYAVVGIGINVNIESFPEDIKHKATSLFIEMGKSVDRIELFKNVLFEVEKCIDSYLLNLDTEILGEYKKLCATLGRNVEVIRGNQRLIGNAVDVGSAGDLIIKTETGEEIFVNSGEVTVQGIY